MTGSVTNLGLPPNWCHTSTRQGRRRRRPGDCRGRRPHPRKRTPPGQGVCALARRRKRPVGCRPGVPPRRSKRRALPAAGGEDRPRDRRFQNFMTRLAIDQLTPGSPPPPMSTRSTSPPSSKNAPGPATAPRWHALRRLVDAHWLTRSGTARRPVFGPGALRQVARSYTLHGLMEDVVWQRDYAPHFALPRHVARMIQHGFTEPGEQRHRPQRRHQRHRVAAPDADARPPAGVGRRLRRLRQDPRHLRA